MVVLEVVEGAATGLIAVALEALVGTGTALVAAFVVGGPIATIWPLPNSSTMHSKKRRMLTKKRLRETSEQKYR